MCFWRRDAPTYYAMQLYHYSDLTARERRLAKVIAVLLLCICALAARADEATPAVPDNGMSALMDDASIGSMLGFPVSDAEFQQFMIDASEDAGDLRPGRLELQPESDTSVGSRVRGWVDRNAPNVGALIPDERGGLYVGVDGEEEEVTLEWRLRF